MKLVNTNNERSFKCCICKGHSKGYGNDPAPLINKTGARTCDACNRKYVMGWRLFLSHEIEGLSDDETEKRLDYYEGLKDWERMEILCKKVS